MGPLTVGLVWEMIQYGGVHRSTRRRRRSKSSQKLATRAPFSSRFCRSRRLFSSNVSDTQASVKPMAQGCPKDAQRVPKLTLANREHHGPHGPACRCIRPFSPRLNPPARTGALEPASQALQDPGAKVLRAYSTLLIGRSRQATPKKKKKTHLWSGLLSAEAVLHGC